MRTIPRTSAGQARRACVDRVAPCALLFLALSLTTVACLPNRERPPDTVLSVRYASTDDLASRFAHGAGVASSGGEKRNTSGRALPRAGREPYRDTELAALREQLLAATAEGRKETQLVTLGLAALEAGDLGAALAATREAWTSLQETRSRTLDEDLATSPLRDYAAAHARVLLATSERREGIVLLERIVSASPAWMPAYRMLFEHYSREGASGLAERVARRALGYGLETEAWPRVALARALRAQGRREEALGVLKAAETAFPSDSTVTSWLGLLLHDAGFLTEACERFALAYARLPGDEEASYNHASCLSREARFEDAEDVLRLAVMRNPGSASLRLLAGNVLRRRGRDADAYRAWREFLDMSDPRDPRRGRVENALEELGRADGTGAGIEPGRR